MEKNLFDFKAYCRLLDEIGKAGNEDDINTVKRLSKAVQSHVENVCVMTRRNEIAYIMDEGRTLGYKIESSDEICDSSRKSAKDAIEHLNSMCRYYRTKKIFTGDVIGRQEVDRFCLEFAKTLFQNRTIE